ncbi:hypothetical protein ACFFJ7_02200 [Pseudochelatococcus lubricantis]|uniref:hypothetical protein n=1 Tax=Pseudochelatococcus lubricantis TaxID=1538102 RepID=UPI0035EB9342
MSGGADRMVADDGRRDEAGPFDGDDPPSAAHVALKQALRRLDAALDAESAFLRQGLAGNFDEITRQKGQCLLDLARLARVVDVQALATGEEGDALRRNVRHIRARLADSEATLARYLDAAREVGAIVSEGMRLAESDGTYAEAGPFGRYGR